MQTKHLPFNDLESQNSKVGVGHNEKLQSETKLGYVNLGVSDLSRSIDYYQQSIGLKLEAEEGSRAYLSAGGENLLALTELPGAVRMPRRSGLYHFALLTPSRKSLGKSLRNLIDTGTEIQGGADHLVSEAIYLADPDGNGIEIYRDRPREEWLDENGQLKMATDPLDFQGVLESANGSNGSWGGLESTTRLGHMHLHVAYLEQSADFYEHVIGFDFLMNYMGSAAFLSTGGYHHHVGLNTWNGVGALPNPQDATGLQFFMVNLFNEDESRKLVERLDQAEWSYEERESGIFVRDPSENGILFETAVP
ncbi:MAG: VOC family protein [Anaerolineales bacterium]|nr:VOC family protein [Anaerolineales bacterium]